MSSKISEVPTHSVDSWRIWDFPVLLAVAAWDEANLESHYLDVVELTKRMQRPDSDHARVAKAVRRLDDAGFLEVQFPAASLPLEFMISRLTPLGLQVCGSWPSSDELAPVVIAALEAKAVDIQRRDPDGASKIRDFARYLSDAGMDIAKSVAAAVISHQLGS